MKSKKNSRTKLLLVVLTILIIVAGVLGIWQLSEKSPIFLATTLKNENPVVVRVLNNEKEEAIGTILYPGIKIDTITVLKNDLANKVAFDVQDSPDGVINIYVQDLLNRYRDIKATRKEIQKSDALNQKAIVLTGSSRTGKITITTWLNQNGLTSVTIEKENSF